jgi:hypothetical protein
MSGLKSALELSLERSNKLVPELKNQKKLTKKQKKEIAEIRSNYGARIADQDVMHLDKIRKLHDQVAPEELETVKAELEKQFRADKKTLEEKMEKEILQSRNS